MVKVMYTVFTIYGPAVQFTVPKGTGVTALFYRDKMLNNNKENKKTKQKKKQTQVLF